MLSWYSSKKHYLFFYIIYLFIFIIHELYFPEEPNNPHDPLFPLLSETTGGAMSPLNLWMLSRMEIVWPLCPLFFWTEDVNLHPNVEWGKWTCIVTADKPSHRHKGSGFHGNTFFSAVWRGTHRSTPIPHPIPHSPSFTGDTLHSLTRVVDSDL